MSLKKPKQNLHGVSPSWPLELAMLEHLKFRFPLSLIKKMQLPKWNSAKLTTVSTSTLINAFMIQRNRQILDFFKPPLKITHDYTLKH